MSSALGPPIKNKENKTPRLTNVEITAGAATTADGAGADGTSGRGGRGGRGGGGGQGGERGRRKWPDNGHTANEHTGGRPPGKKRSDTPQSCIYSVAKKRPGTDHFIGSCPWITGAIKSDLLTTLPNLCLGCLRLKVAAHKYPDNLKEGGHLKYFCQVCKLNTKMCWAPTSHTRSSIPETFLGHAAGQALHAEAGQAALWTKTCINRGSLGSASFLTSSLTLTNGGDSITVEALWDPGLESSFFSADLLPFAVNQRDQSFKIETLSPSASKPEVVHGLEAAFQVAVPGGERVTLRLLQHTGLELRALKLKS